MPPPLYSASDYLWQFQRLLPRGRVWHRGWGTTQAADLLALMPTWARLHVHLNGLLAEAFPCTTMQLLPEWEATLGLPDACIGPLDTLQQRQAAVCTKFAARGGQSIAYYTALAASLGYQIQIEQFAPFRASINHAGDPLYSEAWAHAWRVDVLALEGQTITYFRADQSTAGEPLEAWGDAVLECLIRASAPAHTAVMFAYSTESFWDAGASIWDTGASLWDVGPPPPIREPLASLLLRLPAHVLHDLLDRATHEGKRPAELIASLLEGTP